jgi:hypothetical protein
MLPKQLKLTVEIRVGRRQHSALASRDDLARVEGETRYRPVSFANPFPFSVHTDFAASSTSRVFDQDNVMTGCKWNKSRKIARHPHLMNRKDCARAFRDGLGYTLTIEIVRGRIDINENRRCTAVSDTVGSRDERMARGYNLIAGAHPRGKQGEMESGRATRNRTRVRRANKGSKFAFECGDLGSLRYPARQYGLMSRFGFGRL